MAREASAEADRLGEPEHESPRDESPRDESPQDESPQDDKAAAAPKGIPALIGKVFEWRPVRVFFNYMNNGGDLLAAGMSYSAIFAVFAALWVGFSIAGLFLQANPPLQDALIAQIDTSVPGLIGRGGAVDPDVLLDAGIFGWTGALAAVGLVVTALGWLASARDAVRRIFDLPPPTTFFLLLKVKDLGIAIGFGLVLVISAELSVASTEALGFLFSLIGVGNDSLLEIIVARVVGLAIVLALDTLLLAGLYRVLSGIPIPFRRLIVGCLLGGVALGVLKVLGSALLGGASRNPLLASFAVIIGLLIWFNLICRVILYAASWIAVGMSDRGVPVRSLSPEEKAKNEAQAEADARRLLARVVRRRLEAEYATAKGLRRLVLRRRIGRLPDPEPDEAVEAANGQPAS
jgi:membrane protein